MDESLRFYTGVLGMGVVDKRQRTPPTKGEVVTLRSPGGDQLLELNWYAEGSRFGLPYVNGEELDHLAFDVDDLDGAIAELSRKGVEVVIRPGEIGGGRGGFVKEPHGIWVEVGAREERSPSPSRRLGVWSVQRLGEGDGGGFEPGPPSF